MEPITEEQLKDVVTEIKKIMANEVPKLKGRVELDVRRGNLASDPSPYFALETRVCKRRPFENKSINVELREMDKAERQPVEMASLSDYLFNAIDYNIYDYGSVAGKRMLKNFIYNYTE